MKRHATTFLSASLAAVLGGLSAASAQGAGAVAPPFAGFAPALIVLLAVTATAVIAALVAIRRLRQANTLQDDIFGAIPQPRQVVDSDGRTIFANRAFYDFFGGVDKPTPELLAVEVADDEEARDRLDRLVSNARNGVAGYAELPVRSRGGAEGGGDAAEGSADRAGEWRYVAAHPVSARPGTVLWMVDDITLRRQLEQVMQEEQERFVDLLEHAPIGFYSVDVAGRFLFANQTLCDWLGLSHEDLESGAVQLHDVIAERPPEGTPPYDPVAGAPAARGEVTLKGADGMLFQASINQDLVSDEDGHVLRTRSAVRHLSRERAMAEALEHSVQRFERFFFEAPVGIALLDSSGGITETNRAFAALAGAEAEGLSGTALIRLVNEKDRAGVEALLARPGGGDESEGPAPLEVRFGDGGETVTSMYVKGMTDLAGGTTGSIAHFIDTTERRNLEVQFSQSQKMQAVGQLAGGIAHDFNNLLTAMIGFSDLLLLRHRPGDQSFADIMQIKQNANRAANLVRQLLAFSRQQTLQPRMLDVTDILVELSYLLRRLIGENIELDMIHGRELAMVKADQGQLEQVIINLAVNARDAMSEGGKLAIRTSNVTIRQVRKYKAEEMPPGEYVLIEVEDNGSGIMGEDLDRIFDPFFSTKDVGQGTGLGLSTVYGIVKQTDGFVFVQTEPGKGTTFSIYLPQFEGATQGAAAASDAEAKGTRDLTGAETILLVEDEDAVRSFSARVLRNKGYVVLEANSGEAALELLKDQLAVIDLLVTDVVMPRLDGPSLVRQVREKRPELKVIFISGYTEDAFRKRLGEDGGIEFLPKPFSLKQLAAKVKEVLGEEGANVATGDSPPARAASGTDRAPGP
jgi:two-component system cell cycle sensor histidine kinase/response regulator CckA